MPWIMWRARSDHAGGGRGDPAHHLRVAALVHAVLRPRTRVVLGARDLDARHVAPAQGQRAHAVRVRVPGEVADDVLAPGEHVDERGVVVGGDRSSGRG